ncbi:hypothetical protein HHK36_000163 [Tetracentron sinense]|uniref:Peptidase M48 domain-containing protein n=1 Tax=Tetracentron sinense TaxID=13715 RepID=A0A835DQM6_TETSI|nr:hypothetical protein HHK36_000163 [Tetracentron sinense]
MWVEEESSISSSFDSAKSIVLNVECDMCNGVGATPQFHVDEHCYLAFSGEHANSPEAAVRKAPFTFFWLKTTFAFFWLMCKNEEEVVAVIAHELGHWKLSHTMYSFLAVQVLTLLQFGGYTLVRNSSDLFKSFGFDTQPILIGLILFQHTIIPLQHLVSFGLNLVSRSFEFQADAFARKLGYATALKGGLVKLQEENLSSMNTDPWYSAYHYSHPPLVERLAALDVSDKKED